MKKTIAWILVLALLAVASVLGTIAYLTDEEAAENVMTVGKIDIDLLEYERVGVDTSDGDAVVQEFHDNKPLLPAVIEKGFDYTPGDTYVDWTQDAVEWQQQNDDDGYTSPIWDPAKINNEVDKMVFLRNKGDYGAYVRIYFAFEAGAFTDFEEFREMIHLNLNETGDWEWEWIPFLATNDEGGKYFIANATYKKELLPDDFTDITLSQIALDPTATNEQVAAFGDTYEVFVNAQGIQSAGFTDPDTALDEGFGTDIPFTDLVLSRGIPLKTALHNLNGDESKPITDKVATVTFGLNKDHADKVEGYMGTLSSVEQDADVYTYYLPNVDNNSKYDLYVLADSKIYTPKDSTELFYNMSSLTKIDTANMDTSRTEIMNSFLRNCSNLKEIDTSKWNTSSVTNMSSLFRGCKALEALDVDEWDVSKVEIFERTFHSCQNLKVLDVEGWNTTSAKDLTYMFYECWWFKSLDLTNWDVSNVEIMRCVFAKCTALETLNVSNWDVRKVSTMEGLFYRCESLPTVDISAWKTESVENTNCMFQYCYDLTGITFGEGWDMSKVTDVRGMFDTCESLTKLDIAEWDVSNVTSFYLMFPKCTSLTELDLSGWNTQNVIESTEMFRESNNLVKIYVGDGWNTNAIPSNASGNMFYKCDSLVGGNGTTYDKNKTNKEYARVDTEETPGYFTHISAKPADPEQNQNQ